jgi:hypothetical protein
MKIVLISAFSVLLTAMFGLSAEGAIYTIDSSQSSNTFGFNFGGTDLNEWSAGSSVASLSGSIDATVALGGGLLTFGEVGGVGTSNIMIDQGTAASYRPFAGGALPNGFDEINADGSVDPLNNGDNQFTAGTTNASLTFNEIAFLSISNNTLSFRGTATTGATNAGILTDLQGGYISIDSAALMIPNEELQLIQIGEANDSSSDVGYNFDGNVETIIIPYSFSFLDAPGGTNTLSFSGTVVATRTVSAVPEPSSGLFLAGIAVGFYGIARRRRK